MLRARMRMTISASTTPPQASHGPKVVMAPGPDDDDDRDDDEGADGWRYRATGSFAVEASPGAGVAPETLWERLCQTDLPKLWIPKRESLLAIEAIPTLGTGKIDLRRVKQLALERAAAVQQEIQ